MLTKPERRFILSIFSCLSVLVLILSGCTAAGTPTTSATGVPNQKADKGGTWIDDIANDPDSLIPNGSSQTFATLMDQALYAPLFVGDKTGKIQPNIVQDLPSTSNNEVSADLKTWTFKLKSGLKWSDGQPLNADDIDYSWRLWTNKAFGAANTVGFNLITSADVSSDKLSITFHLGQAFAPFLSIWTDGNAAPLPKHYFSSMAPDAILKTAASLKPSVVDGPFTMSESVKGDHYTLLKNPNYFRASEGLPYLNKLIFRPVASQETILNDFKAGSITSAWFLDVSKTPEYKTLADYTLVSSPYSANFEYIVVNFDNPILGKYPEVRQAMAEAIDHDALIRTARLGQAFPLCTDHSKSFNPGYQSDAKCPKFDAAAAKQLLDQKGWKAGADGVRVKDGQRLEFKYATTSGKPWRINDENLIQQNFQDIGIKINIDNQPSSTFFGPYLNGGKHDLAEYENSFTYDPDDSIISSCSQIPSRNGGHGQNRSFWCNDQAQQLLKQEQTSLDPKVRQDAFNKLHDIYLTEYPFIILYAAPDLALSKKTTHNYFPGPMGSSETVNVWEWWCNGGQC